MHGATKEEPTTIERVADRFCGTRTLLGLLGAALAWIVLNRALQQLECDVIDPYPFRWLQRASILVNGVLIYVGLQASSERRARAARHERTQRMLREIAQRELLEAVAAATLRQGVAALRAQTKH